MEDKKLSKIQNIVIGGVSSLSMIGVYTLGVTLSRNSDLYPKQLFIGGAVMSIVVPHVADKVLTLSFNKYNNRKKKKDKEYDD